MALVTRPLKIGTGVSSYVDKVAGGSLDIIDLDLDNDWQAIVDQVNGNIDGNNIKPLSITNALVANGAAIAYAKLNLANGIVNADVNAAAAIAGSKLADVSVPNAKLGVNSSVRHIVGAGATPGTFANSEHAVCTLPTFTPAGGRVYLLGTIVASLSLAAAAAGHVGWRVYRNDGAGFNLLAGLDFEYGVSNANAAGIIIPLPMPSAIDLPPAGNPVIYEWRLVSDSAAIAYVVAASNAGFAFAVELA